LAVEESLFAGAPSLPPATALCRIYFGVAWGSLKIAPYRYSREPFMPSAPVFAPSLFFSAHDPARGFRNRRAPVAYFFPSFYLLLSISFLGLVGSLVPSHLRRELFFLLRPRSSLDCGWRSFARPSTVRSASSAKDAMDRVDEGFGLPFFSLPFSLSKASGFSGLFFPPRFTLICRWPLVLFVVLSPDVWNELLFLAVQKVTAP